MMHARPVCVEDPRHLDLEPVLPVVVEEEGFGAALALIVAGAWADGIDVAPVAFGLRVNFWIAVDFTGRSLEDLALETLGQAQHVDCAVDRSFRRLNRVVLVMHRRGWAGEIVDLVDLHREWESYVVTHELEAGMIVQMINIALVAGEEVVETQHLVPLRKQPINQMRADEPRTPRHKNAFATFVEQRHIGSFRTSGRLDDHHGTMMTTLKQGQTFILKQSVSKRVSSFVALVSKIGSTQKAGTCTSSRPTGAP